MEDASQHLWEGVVCMEGTTEMGIRLFSLIKNINLSRGLHSDHCSTFCTLAKQCIRMTNSTGKRRASHPGYSHLHIVYARRNSLGSRTVGLLLLLLHIQCFDFLMGLGRPHLSAKMWGCGFEFPTYSFLTVSWTTLAFNGKNKLLAKIRKQDRELKKT